MKTIFLPALFTVCLGLFSNNDFAQKKQSRSDKNEEIIIRKNEDSPSKMTIVIDSNKITVNGQPLSDYNGDVMVFKRNFMGGDRNNNFSSPGDHFKLYSNSNKALLGVYTGKAEKGAVIKSVIDKSSADKAGLEQDDIITQFGDKDITSPDDLRDAVHAYQPGDKVTVQYLRDGKEKSAEVELGKSDDSAGMTYNIDSLRNLMNGFNRGNNFNYRRPQFPGNNFNFYNRQQRLGLKIEDTQNDNGAKVLNVQEGSAAEKAGIKAGDIITEVNGEKVSNVTDVRSQLNRSENKNDYKIKAKRNNAEMNFEVHIPKTLKSIDI
jgi:serine protease Do